MNFTFTTYLRVFDAPSLYRAACQRLEKESGADLTEDDYASCLGSVDYPDIEACLVMLLDPGLIPGCSIDMSGAEADSVMDVDLGDEDRDPRGGSDE